MFDDKPETFLSAFRYLAACYFPHIKLVEMTAKEAAEKGLT